MKASFIALPLLSLLLVNALPAQAFSNNSKQEPTTAEYNAWLKEKFSKQHEALIPVVAVADMFYSCNKAREVDSTVEEITYLINEMPKNKLAEKLALCLGEDSMQSDIALNFGLQGCFHEQLAHLPEVERQQKMVLVEKAILSLSRGERKKSFTQCVTEQAIHYLQ
ncbi:hypothetical protein A9Q74_08010 [Colwellia sp. 39_35_sub15_T18]|nr:hypothetical protein A9Q74_08010 [Colwellia sp. 39_35_sub15_T18]